MTARSLNPDFHPSIPVWKLISIHLWDHRWTNQDVWKQRKTDTVLAKENSVLKANHQEARLSLLFTVRINVIGPLRGSNEQHVHRRAAWLGSLLVPSGLRLRGDRQHSSQRRLSVCVFSAGEARKRARHLPLQLIPVGPALRLNAPSVDQLHVEQRQLDAPRHPLQRERVPHVSQLLQQHSLPHLHRDRSLLGSGLPSAVLFPKVEKMCVHGQPCHLDFRNHPQRGYSVGRWNSCRILWCQEV